MIRDGRVNHFAVADACRANPGAWQPVGEYNSSHSARGAAIYIRKACTGGSAQRSAYEPAGAFETRQALTEFGARVEARYIGTSNDTAWDDAVASLIGDAA